MEHMQLDREEERQKFHDLFPVLVEDLVSCPKLQDMPETNLWLKKVLEYTVPFGKQNRGLFVILAYKHLATDITEENARLSAVLGWCVELLQAFLLILDDIMDASLTRRGRPCWHKVDGQGNLACNDAILLEASIYYLLKKYFGQKDFYVDLLDTFHEATHRTVYGQSLDTRTGAQEWFDRYTTSRYASITKYKAGYYTFCLPVFLGMIMVITFHPNSSIFANFYHPQPLKAGIRDTVLMEAAENVLLHMGFLFQVQDDYLDCFGDPVVTGKMGSDIAEAKCTWLVVTALQKANAAQRQIIEENYGHNSAETVSRIKELYDDMEISKMFGNFEENHFMLINQEIDVLPARLPPKLFRDMLDMFFRRQK